MRAAEFRVFLSSTFRDLQPEREHLIKKVFPRIRAKCRERGVEFTEIDLRWGITAEESRSGKVVRICLEEIDRSPYFIGIFGSRYGWVPGIEELEKDEDVLQRYPWLREYGEAGKSIIEMEVVHGALRRDHADSAFFYEQTSHLDEVPRDEALPFEQLKERLRDRELPYRPFATPEELGEHVYRDLLQLLDRDWPTRRERTEAEIEHAMHEAFALNRTQAYVANPQYFEHFSKFVQGDEPTMVLWGRSGLGKSALLAHLTSEYLTRNPQGFVIRHFVGATSGLNHAADVIRHVMRGIAEHYELPDEIPNDDAKLAEEFPTWLAKVRQEDTLILAIDAVNQLFGIGPEMHWLPEFIPANIRLLVSTTPGTPLDQLRKRNWQELEIHELGHEQKRRISEEFLARFHKTLTGDQLRLIASANKTESPLFLRTLLEELRVFGEHETIDEHLAGYLGCADEPALFQRILARMESDFGVEVVTPVMTAIWASRSGLSESEVFEITALPRLELSELLLSLEFHLMQRSGLYTFFHNYLREAVELRYLAGEDAKRESHAQLAQYFSTREYDVRRRDEEPWQWQHSGDIGALQSCLMYPRMVALFDSEREAYEAYSYWKDISRVGFDVAYLDRLRTEELPTETKFKAYKSICDLFVTAGQYDSAADFLDAGYGDFVGAVDERLLLDMQEMRAELETHRGKFESAIARANELLDSRKAMLDAYPVVRHKLMDLLSVSYYSLGKYSEAETITRKLVAIATKQYGPNSYETAKEYKNLGALLTAGKRLVEGEAACLQALSLFSALFGDSHPETTLCRMNLAVCLMYQYRLEDATREYSIAEKRLEFVLGPGHTETLNCRNNIANLLAEQGRIEDGRTIAIDLLQRYVNSFGEEALMTAVVGIFIGYTYYLDKRYETAKEYYEKYLPIRIKIQGELHPDVIRFRERLDEINRALNR